MKEEALEMMRENQFKIQAVAFVSSLAHIREQNRHLQEWLWKLRDDIDDADDDIGADQGGWLADYDSSANWDVGEETDVHGDDSLEIYGLNVICNVEGSF
ncbi:hypothetical protein IEQ34_008072 [Dendrobium chrysotoxum]|uniref:Uncharacterized protein n=1 Tax=Dendrobium chrysotoxum TaxID=161865 RepID=A0AAV7H7K5_DENCH|nr:hypothetical protein IEQ34_008072 [Dendrobium chrysotoxum]